MHGRTRFQALICGMYSRHPLDSGRNLYFLHGPTVLRQREVADRQGSNARNLSLCLHLSIASPGVPPPPLGEHGIWPLRFTRVWGIWPRGGLQGGAHWPTPVCTVICACIGWGCLSISSVPGWGLRIHLTPPPPPWSNPHHFPGGCPGACNWTRRERRTNLKAEFIGWVEQGSVNRKGPGANRWWTTANIPVNRCGNSTEGATLKQVQ